MASKKTKAKKPRSRAAASKKPKRKAPTKPAKKRSVPKTKSAPKRAKKPKKAAKKQAAVKPPKTFAEKVRGRDPATEAWYRAGDVLSHGVILGPGAAGNVMVVSNGVVSGVPAEDLFETQAAAARAVR